MAGEYSINDGNEVFFLKWITALLGGTSNPSTPSSGITIKSEPVTTVLAAVTASATGTIPAGSKGWSFAILTGTATYGGATVAAGFFDSSEKTTVNAITFTMAAASTGVLRYGT